MRTLLLGATVAAVAAVAVSACGGGSNNASSSPLTAAQWRRQANAICRHVGKKVRRVPRPTAESQIEEFIATVLPLWKQEEDRLGALTPPKELAPDVADFVSALYYLNVALLEIHIATERNDGLRRFYAVKKLRVAERGVKLRGAALGLPACARQRFPSG